MSRRDSYEKWRHHLMQILLLMILIVFFVEMSMYFLVEEADIHAPSYIQYMKLYALLPTGINLLIWLIGKILLGRKSFRIAIKNRITIVCLLGICFVITYFHRYFSATGVSFVLVIMLSGLFGDTRVTRNTSIAGAIALLIAFWLPPIDGINELRMQKQDFTIHIMFIYAAYQFVQIIIRHGQEQSRALRENYSRLNQTEQKLLTDSLTGLYNQSAFYHILEKQMQECKNNRHPLCLVVVDIDDFKKVNDTYGHEQGNEVLVKLSQLFLDVCEDNIYINRYGGEEFALVFPGYDENQTKKVMEVIRSRFEKTTYSFLPEGGITFSCGIKACTRDITSTQQLFEYADQAMYYAKNRGKNQSYVLYSSQGLQGTGMKWKQKDSRLNQQMEELADKYGNDR